MREKTKRLLAGGCACFAMTLATAFVGIAQIPTKADDTPTDSHTEIIPLVQTSFEKGTVGQAYPIDREEGSAFWDENYTMGQIVDAFDGKAYQFTGVNNGGYISFGGIKGTDAVAGHAYTLSLKLDIGTCDYLFVEYVATGGQGSVNGYGALKLYADGSILPNDGSNMTATYDATTKTLSVTVVAGKKVWDENTSDPGFFKFVGYKADLSGANLIIDDVCLREADVVFYEDWENKPVGAYDANNLFCNLWTERSTASVVDYGGGKAVKLTQTSADGDYCTLGYLNRLGMLTDGKTYSVSMDYELIGYNNFFVEYVPGSGGAGVNITEDGAFSYAWSQGNLADATVTTDAGNPAKGTLTFTLTVLEGKTEFKFTGQTPSESGENALILDNIRIDSFRQSLSVTTEGAGKVSATTFQPVTGSDAKVYVTPDEGWQVKSFKVDGEIAELAADTSYTFESVSAAHTVAVEFEKKPVNLNISSSDGATVTVDNQSPVYGDDITFTLEVADGYRLISATLNGQEIAFSENTYTLTNVKDDLTLVITAQEINVYNMTYGSNTGRGVTCSADTVREGESVTFTVTAEEGYALSSVTYNGTEVTLQDGRYTVENVSQSGYLIARFVKTGGQPAHTPSAAETIRPLVQTSFERGTVGQAYQIDKQEGDDFWDENYTMGQIVDAFDGKAYQFTGINDGFGYIPFGGIKGTAAVAGHAYTLSLKLDIGTCDYLFVEYVSTGGQGSVNGYGALKLYADGSILPNDGSNMTATYDVATKTLSVTVVAGKKVWDENTSEPGFFKFVGYKADLSGANLIIDDVCLREADLVFYEDWENKTAGAYDANNLFCNIWTEMSAASIVECDGGKALKLTQNYDEYGYCRLGYLNRLGMLTDGKTYSVSIDYELIGYNNFYVEYLPGSGGAGINITKDGTLSYAWGQGDNLFGAFITTDQDNPAKGTLTFTLKILEGKTEFRFLGQAPSESGESALILDNIRIDSFRQSVNVTAEGEGKVSATTFQPVTGSDAKIYVMPDEGWQVKSFKVDGEIAELAADMSYTFESVSAAHMVAVEFERKPVSVRIDATDGVTVGIEDKNFVYGDDIAFTVTVTEGYRLIAVRLNGEAVSLTDGAYTVTGATEDINLVVVAEKIPEYAMRYTANEGGSVTCSAEKVQEGGSATYTVTADEGYRIKSVKYNGATVALEDGCYTVENVTAAGNLTVEFEPDSPAPGPADPEKASGGCGSSLGGGSAVLGVGIALILLAKRKRKEE